MCCAITHLLGTPISEGRSSLTSFFTRSHTILQVRGDTAEYLYLVLQSKDLGLETDEVEDILLETAWYV